MKVKRAAVVGGGGGGGRRRVVLLGRKVVMLTAIFLCLLALFRLHSLSSSSSYRPRPARVRSIFVGPPKLAFLFLARRDLPLDFIWDSFFHNADVANFSIYIHSVPGFEFDDSTTRSPFFYGRHLKRSVQVEWGGSSMIEAERLLLSAALDDPANQRFVLLSDSCVPLSNFSYIYNYVMASQKSFLDSFIDSKEQRYNKKMSLTIPKDKWRKGSQWIALVRSHAELIVDDEIILPIFKKHCKRRPPLDVSQEKLISKLQKQHNCIPDEHYVQTLLSLSGLEGELERRTLTYTVWNVSATKTVHKGWHPMTFTYADASPQKIKEIKEINHVYYETEYRTEWCRTNSTSAPCFLFARKFSRGAAMRLLGEGTVGPFDAAAILSTPP